MLHFRYLSYAILSINSLRFWCESYDIKHSDIVIRQAMLESTYMRCKNCALSEHNNLWGFQTSEGYMKFSHWSESVEFYAKFQKQYYKGGDYYDFLYKNWNAENMDKYIKLLKQINLK